MLLAGFFTFVLTKRRKNALKSTNKEDKRSMRDDRTSAIDAPLEREVRFHNADSSYFLKPEIMRYVISILFALIISIRAPL